VAAGFKFRGAEIAPVWWRRIGLEYWGLGVRGSLRAEFFEEED